MTPEKPGKDIKMTNAFALSDDDVIKAMKEIEGYLDISVQDFRELYIIALKHARERFLRSTTVEKIMRAEVIAIDRGANLEAIISALADNAVSGLPVVDDAGHVVGVVSEKDIFTMLSGKDGASFWEVLSGCLQSNSCLMKSITTATAGDLMTSPAITVERSVSVWDAMELCQQKKINRLPVVDKDKKLAGIVTRTDILQAHLDFGDK